jgi:hypothetical protein
MLEIQVQQAIQAQPALLDLLETQVAQETKEHLVQLGLLV